MTVRAGQEFSGVPASARSARTFVAALVEDAPLRDAAVLAVSELAANAILHSRSGLPGGTFAVYVEACNGESAAAWAYVEVTDRGGGTIPLDRREVPAHAGNGRGLGVVRALAAEWGVISSADGHRVWGRYDSTSVLT
jgi:serine/threonine-protein kinase RsbW